MVKAAAYNILLKVLALASQGFNMPPGSPDNSITLFTKDAFFKDREVALRIGDKGFLFGFDALLLALPELAEVWTWQRAHGAFQVQTPMERPLLESLFVCLALNACRNHPIANRLAKMAGEGTMGTLLGALALRSSPSANPTSARGGWVATHSSQGYSK